MTVMSHLRNCTLAPPRLFGLAAGLFLITASLTLGPASAQSFDCHNARHPDEKTICEDSRLGQLDQELASVYGRNIDKIPKGQRGDIEQNETLFLNARRRCGQDRNCIEQSYRNRIEEIQQSLAEREADKSGRASTVKSKASAAHRRSSGVGITGPEQEPEAKDGTPGEGEAVVAPTERDAHSSAPTAGTPATENQHSEREIRPSRHTTTRSTLSVLPERVIQRDGMKAESAKREPRGSGAATAPEVPENRKASKKGGTVAASATPAKEQTAAPSRPATPTGSGSRGWVNPPPER